MDYNVDVSLLQKALRAFGITIEVTKSSPHPIQEQATHRKNGLAISFQHKDTGYVARLQIREDQVLPFLKQCNVYNDIELDLHTILESCREVIFVSDKSGKALRVSKSWRELFYSEGEAFFQKGVFQVEKEGIITPSATRLVMEQEEHVQIIQETKNGRTLMVTGMPIKDKNGEIQRIVSISEDITELHTLKKKLSAEKVKNKRLNERLYDSTLPSLIFNSEAMNSVMWTVLKIAPVDSTVLITGESGVGKEIIAEYIHRWSNRSGQPFIKINCGSIPENLLESELFGYVKGAFTGATEEGKKGLFEEAHGGTIFLDEIGEIPVALQVKLLRVLQEQEVRRIGSTSSKKIDVRVIAATNRHLETEIKEGNFREDLFYRLHVVPLYIPPLRDRLDDLLQLVLHFTDTFNRKLNSTKFFSPESINQFYRYNWPGNVRELQNIMERTMVMADTNYIEPQHLPDFLQSLPKESQGEEKNSQALLETPQTKGQTKNISAIYSQLARSYRQLGITHGEWGLLSIIFTFEGEGWTFYVTEEELAPYLQCGTRQVRKWLQSLKQKGYLQVTHQWKRKGFNVDPLIKHIKMKE